MLSSEASALTRLILARHALICRASELGRTAAAAGLTRGARAGAPRGALAEIVLMPGRIGELDERISRAWRRLAEVRPR
jgi:hypothetical protein